MIRRAYDRLRCLLGAPGRARRRHADDLLVLMYHGVVEAPLAPFCWHQLPAEAFAQQIAWVAKHYGILPLEDALEQRAAGTLPPRSAAITFDDGFRNNRTIAAPILAAHDAHATIFLPTQALDDGTTLWPDRVYLAIARTQVPQVALPEILAGSFDLTSTAAKEAALRAILNQLKLMPTEITESAVAQLEADLGAPTGGGPADDFALLTWDDVAAMQATGRFAFGPHTRTHPILSRCEPSRAREEIHGSQADVVSRTGITPRVFAYPNGRRIDFKSWNQDAVREVCRWAVTTENWHVVPQSEDLALPRICVGSDLTFDRFRLLASGAHRR